MSRVHKLMAKDSLNLPGVLRHPNGELTNSHEEAAKLLLDTHFPGNANVNTDGPSNRFRDITFREDIVTDEIVTSDRIHWALTSFEPYKSPGLDEIYPVLIQKAWNLIKSHITVIYRASLSLGYVPKLWQQVRVIFIPKPGKDDYTQPKSFRPISLPSFFLKGMERLC